MTRHVKSPTTERHIGRMFACIVHEDRCQDDSSAPLLVLLGGVPGAGKTAAITALRALASRVRTTDPERVRNRLSAWLPRLPYACARPVVHTIAHVWAVSRILHRGGGSLVIHEPGTRRWSRRLIVILAMALDYRPVIVFIDTDRQSALSGQLRRQRVVRRESFDRHWRRWLDIRERILESGEISEDEPWCRIVLSDRDKVVDDLLLLLRTGHDNFRAGIGCGR